MNPKNFEDTARDWTNDQIEKLKLDVANKRMTDDASARTYSFALDCLNKHGEYDFDRAWHEFYNAISYDDGDFEPVAKTTVTNSYGREIDADAAGLLMDSDLREEVHSKAEYEEGNEQSFFDAYCKAHALRFGSEFEPAKENPVW